jgi:deoxycytidylate deaminase
MPVTVVRGRGTDPVLRVGAVVVENAAVIAREDDERVGGQLQAVERV